MIQFACVLGSFNFNWNDISVEKTVLVKDAILNLNLNDGDKVSIPFQGEGRWIEYEEDPYPIDGKELALRAVKREKFLYAESYGYIPVQSIQSFSVEESETRSVKVTWRFVGIRNWHVLDWLVNFVLLSFLIFFVAAVALAIRMLLK